MKGVITMNYSRRVYNRAAAVLEKRRYQAEHDQRMHRQEAYSSIPELAAIDREIAFIKEKSCGTKAQRGYAQSRRLSEELP